MINGRLMWVGPFRNNKERDNAIEELQELVKKLMKVVE